jgi:hypothetical protein
MLLQSVVCASASFCAVVGGTDAVIGRAAGSGGLAP